jgi:hypothetical protein
MSTLQLCIYLFEEKHPGLRILCGKALRYKLLLHKCVVKSSYTSVVLFVTYPKHILWLAIPSSCVIITSCSIHPQPLVLTPLIDPEQLVITIPLVSVLLGCDVMWTRNYIPTFRRNILSHMVSQPRRTTLTSSPPWEPQISYIPLHIHSGIMPDGRINKMADLQETKFLGLFALTNVHYQYPYAQM